jgi:hypothetical protein
MPEPNDTNEPNKDDTIHNKDVDKPTSEDIALDIQLPPNTADVLQALREASRRLVDKTAKHPQVKQWKGIDIGIPIAERRAKRRMRKALDKSG